MRRTAFLFILTIILMTCCTTRRSQYDGLLVSIDSLTEVNADSARMRLSQLSQEMNEAPERIQMYYHLLQVKANDKAHIKHTSDSLICEVADYYKQHLKEGRLPEAYYYVGRANADMLNSEKAFFYFQKALLEDSLHVTTHLKSRIYAQIGYIYLRNGLLAEAIGMQQLAYFYCKEEGDTLGMRYSSEDIHTIQTLLKDSTFKQMPNSGVITRIQQLNTHFKNQVLNEQNAQLQAENEKEKTLIWIAVGLSIVIIAAISLLMLRQHKQKTNASTDTKTPHLQRHFYDKDISDLLTTHLYNNKVLKTSDWQLIEERLLTAFPTFRDNLFSLYQLSETEYHICLLIKLEVSPSNMAKLMATGNSTISQSRLRMQQKVFNGQGTAKDWDNYVLSL